MTDNPAAAISPDASPGDLFLVSQSNQYNYGDLHLFADFLIHFLDDYTVSVSNPVAIQARLSDLTIFTIAACWMQNIPFVCLNSHGQIQALKKQIATLNPAIIIADAKDDAPQLAWEVHNIRLSLSKILAEKEFKKSIVFETSYHKNEQIFSYFLTSGTSGTPKIVPLKRRQMVAAVCTSAQNIRPQSDECWLLCMPLDHVGGVSLILRSLLYGSAIYRMNGFDASSVASLLADSKRIVAASLVPTMLKRLLDRPLFKTHDGFKGILLGGGPASHLLLQNCCDRNIPVISSYGMTETCAQIAANPVNETQNFDAVGKIFEPNRVQIRNKAGQPLDAHQLGIIWLKGPQIFDGYLRGYGHEDAIDKKGWFNTGDFGRLDQTQGLSVEARRADLIVTGGENVLPFEVEDVLQALPGVKEAAVFGVPDEEWGQKVVAAVVPAAEQPFSTMQLHSALRKKLPGFKIPKQFIAVDQLPRTRSGKVRRGELHKLL